MEQKLRAGNDLTNQVLLPSCHSDGRFWAWVTSNGRKQGKLSPILKLNSQW